MAGISNTRLALANASDALARIDPPPLLGEGRVGNVAALQPPPRNRPLPTPEPLSKGPRSRESEKQRKPRNSSPRLRGEIRASLQAPAGFDKRSAGVDVAAYMAAIALAGVAAFFSIRGMMVLFPGAPAAVVAMAGAMEAAKLVTAAWLAARWNATAWVWRLALVAMIAGVAVINATGVYAQLVAAHVGAREEAQSAIEMQDAALGGKIEAATHNVADLDRRLNQVDTAIEEAARRGKTATALSAIDGQRKARAALVDQRRQGAEVLADLKAERAALGAKGRRIESEAAPIRYVAELVGSDADSEQAIRWLILLMVLTCDPLAIALTAAASAQRGRT
jgi:hypothetical protein